jgi:hypothetical protein
MNVEVKVPWGDGEPQGQPPQSPPQEGQPQQQELSDGGEWKWDGSGWVPVNPGELMRSQ